MRRKFYTIFILPHAEARFRKLHCSRNFVLSVACAAVLVGIAGVTAPHLLLRIRSQSEAIERLREENTKLLAEKRHFEASLTELGNVVGTVENRARKIAAALGLDPLPSSSPTGGLGGRRSPGRDSLQDMLNEEMEALRLRSRNLDASFEHLDQALRARERILASTPSGLPVAGFFSAGFGWRNDPITGEREFHDGLDIVAPEGTAIRAPADGVVTSAERRAGYGRSVHISHGFGYATRYGHLSEVHVRPGQRVRRGDVIGTVGSTGRSTGPHLHYEVFKAGRPVNPGRYVDERPS